MAARIGSGEITVDADTKPFRRDLRQLERAGGVAGARTGNAFDRSFSSTMDKSGTNSFKKFSDKLKGLWSGMSQNARQWTLIIGAVLASMEQLAVLGSAAGAGLLVLGGAATGALVGVGALVTAFVGLNKDLEELPESIRPAAKAFQDLKTPLQEAQQLLQERAFANGAASFAKIGDAIRDLTPSLGVLGDSVGRVVDRFADWVSSADGVRLVSGLLEKSGPIFEKVMTIVGKLGTALLEAFNNPRFQKAIDDMLTGLDGLMETFGKFVQSDEFGVWIEETSAVLGELGGLIGDVSTMFSDLITPESYQRTKDFLNTLSEMTVPLGDLLAALGEADVFGILAESLTILLTALQPVWDVLEPMAELIGTLLVGSLEHLSNMFILLTPFLEIVRIGFEVLAGWTQKWLEYLQPFNDAFQVLGNAFRVAGDLIWDKLQPAFDILFQAIIDLLPTAEEFTTWVNDYAVPAIEDFAHWLGDEGAKAIEEFASWLTDEAVPAMQDFWEWLSTKVWPVVNEASANLGRAVGAFQVFVSGVTSALSVLTAPIKFAIDLFNRLAGAASGGIAAATAAGKSAGGAFPKYASGGILNGPRHILAGEAGAEAIVPLNRNLNSVDPSVRYLSAIAQGKVPAMASGGIVGGGRTNVIEAGAIVVYDSFNPLTTSVEILNRLADNLD